MRTLIPIILLGSLSCFIGCSWSSVITDIHRESAREPPYTSYRELMRDCQDEIVTIVMRDGRRQEGILLQASPDSIGWLGRSDSVPQCSPSYDILRIERTSHLIPSLLTVPICLTAFGIYGAVIGRSGGGGKTESEGAPALQVITWSALGTAFGVLIGRAFNFTYAYEVTPLSLRKVPALELTEPSSRP